jgi:type VI secretion system secreted protein VgrG
VDGAGRPTTYTYGGGSDLTRVEYPDGSDEEYSYHGTFHKVTSYTNGAGNVFAYAYDGATGDLLTATDPLGAVTTYVWSNGLLQSRTDPRGHDTTYHYSGTVSRRLEATADALGGRVTLGYDAAGRVRRSPPTPGVCLWPSAAPLVSTVGQRQNRTAPPGRRCACRSGGRTGRGSRPA